MFKPAVHGLMMMLTLGAVGCDGASGNDGGSDAGTDDGGTTGETAGFVPAGEFWMGCDFDNLGWACDPNNETPYHQVYLDAFEIDVTEVTVAAYADCVDASVCTAPVSDRQELNWDKGDRDDHPVNGVTWQQAKTYCEDWADSRLCTEAEWEKAARGTEGWLYPWGDAEPECGVHAILLQNIDGQNRSGCGTGLTSPVGSVPAGDSPYGVKDMAGNVMEWVADWYASDYYATSPAENPQGPASGEGHTCRGGSYSSYPSYVRAVFRTWYRDSVSSATAAGLGFRCCRSVP